MAIFTFNEALKKSGTKATEVTSLGLPNQNNNTQSQSQVFLNKSTMGQIFSPETAKEVPGALYDTFVKQPLKFAKSAVESPINMVQSAMGKPITSTPGKGLMGEEITSYQSDFQNKTLPAVEKGEISPLEGTLQTTGDVARGALDALGAEGLIKGGIAATKGVVENAPKVIQAIKPAVSATGRVLKNTGEGAYGITITPEKSTLQAMQNYQAKQPSLFSRIKNMVTGATTDGQPITEANTAARKGLVGTEWQLGVQAKQVANDLWKSTILPKLQSVKGAVNMKSFLGEVEKEIAKSGGDITRRTALKEALNAIKNDYKNVSNINLEKLQDYKKGWAEFLPDATYNGKPIAASLKEVHNLMAQKAREVIYKYIGEEGKQAYIDWGNLQSIEEAGIKSGLGDPAAKSISKNAWQFIMNKVITPIATTGGKVLYKTGEGLEFIGQKGAKKVGDIIK
jgi:hypothetical protein